MNKTIRYLKLLLVGIVTFKDWPLWLRWKFGLFHPIRNEITFRIRSGEKFILNPKRDDRGSVQEIYLQNNYFKNYLLKENDVVIDIGAYIGVFAVYAAKKAKNIKVISYEPIATTFERLKKNIAINKLNDRIKPLCLAISKEAGSKKIFISPDTDASNTAFFSENSLRAGFKKDNYEIVPTISFEDIFETNKVDRCDFLKIDCEGGEFEIILNAHPATLKKISHIAMEYHSDPSSLSDYLRKYGFVVELNETNNGCGFLWADKI